MGAIKLYVPATIANIGPGFDVLGLALEGLGNTYEISLCAYPSRVIGITGVDIERVPIDPRKNLTLLAAHKMSRNLGHPEVYFSVKQHQELPVGGGLGSSAAACLAGVYAAASLLDTPISSKILETAYEFEGHYDNLAPAYYGGMTIASRDFIMKVAQGCELWVVVVTPKMRLSTKLARSVLPRELPQKDWVAQMALSCALVCAWQQGDLEGISKALRDPYAEPKRAPLISGFYEIKRAALGAGALGCSISGAGPSSFALFGDESRARDFAKAYQGHCGRVLETSFIKLL